jgi:predicted transcriptional regulator
MPIPENLEEVAERIHETGDTHRETVRTLLSWFGQQRRGRWVVARIRRALREAELITVPEFDTAYIDGYVEFRSARIARANGDGESDPVVRVRMLAAANRAPLAIARDQAVTEATTLMLLNDYSQLPVMPNERDVHGMMSWRSIGRTRALNRECELVQDCMDHAIEIRADEPLLSAIDSIIRNEVVLVRGADRRITGILTASDLSLQFREMAEPFLLVGEIENHVRRLIDGKFTADQLRAARDPADPTRDVESVDDLSFGEYIRLLQNPTHWDRLNIRLNGGPILERLERVRDIRNDVMHFSPDGVSNEDVEFLRDTVTFFQLLT